MAASSSPPPSLSRLLNSLLSSLPDAQSDPDLALIAFQFGSALTSAATKSLLNINSASNSLAWPLPYELTLKVMGLVDTTSLCHASATCKGFKKFGKEPSCYSHIDLTRNWKKVDDSVLSTMIRRAGKNLRSIKIGADSEFDSEETLNEPPLTKSCLEVLILDNIGGLLEKLCLKYIHKMDKTELVKVLSNCKSLIDLEIVGLNVGLGGILKPVSENCPLMERFCFDYSHFSRPPLVKISENLMNKFKMLTSLSLKGCVLHDFILSQLIKGLTKIKHVDFSASLCLKGSFLRVLGDVNSGPEDSLETLILRHCQFLQSDEFASFFYAVLAGKWKSLKLIDLTSKCKEYIVCRVKVFDLFKKRRPDISLLVDSPYDEEYFSDEETFSDDELSENEDEQNKDDDYSSEDEISENEDEENVD